MILWDALAEFGHAYVDMFVRPLKILFPKEVWFYRPDNKEGWFAYREQPLGYWVGHVIGYAAPPLLIWCHL